MVEPKGDDLRVKSVEIIVHIFQTPIRYVQVVRGATTKRIEPENLKFMLMYSLHGLKYYVEYANG